jgi:hypothetical protein
MSRQITIYTGIKGAIAIDNALKKQARVEHAKQIVMELSEVFKLTDDESTNLLKMINSNDPESLTLAEEILKTR